MSIEWHPCRIPHGDSAVEEIVSGSGEFIRNESLSGAIMMLPWLRHLPFVRDKFLASKRAPLKMRKMQVASSYRVTHLVGENLPLT